MDIEDKNFTKIWSNASRTKWIRRLIASEVAEQYNIVLDIGCGPGYTTVLLNSLLNARQIYGLDIDENMIEYAKQNHMKDNIRYIRQDFSVEFECMAPEVRALEGKVGLILAQSCLHYISDKELVARNLKRLSRKWGKVLINITHRCDPFGDLPAEEMALHEKVFMKIPERQQEFNHWLTAFKCVGFDVVNKELISVVEKVSKDYFTEYLLPLKLSDFRIHFVDESDERKTRTKLKLLSDKIMTNIRQFMDRNTGEIMVENEVGHFRIILQN